MIINSMEPDVHSNDVILNLILQGVEHKKGVMYRRGFYSGPLITSENSDD